MSPVEKAIALLTYISARDLQELPPVRRQQIAETCRRVADMADQPVITPRAGVLADLRHGRSYE